MVEVRDKVYFLVAVAAIILVFCVMTIIEVGVDYGLIVDYMGVHKKRCIGIACNEQKRQKRSN